MFFYGFCVKSRVLLETVRNTAGTHTLDQILITFVFRIRASVQRSASYASYALDLFSLHIQSCSHFRHLHYSNQC